MVNIDCGDNGWIYRKFVDSYQIPWYIARATMKTRTQPTPMHDEQERKVSFLLSRSPSCFELTLPPTATSLHPRFEPLVVVQVRTVSGTSHITGGRPDPNTSCHDSIHLVRSDPFAAVSRLDRLSVNARIHVPRPIPGDACRSMRLPH